MLTDLCRSQLNDLNNDFAFRSADTAKTDCNVAMVSQGVELATNVKLSAQTARAIAHQAYGPTGNVFARSVFIGRGLRPGDEYQILWGVPIQDVRDLLDTGWFVTLFVDYGVLNQLAHEITGDKNFTGYHAVGLSDFWRGRLGRMVHYHDPLCDGRRPAIPKGVQAVKFGPIRDAAYAYTREPGFVEGWAVKKA